MLSDFYIAIDDFTYELKECNRALSTFQNLNFYQSTKMLSLGEDIGSLSENFARAHINATMWIVDELNQVRRGSPIPFSNHEHLEKYISGNTELPPEAKNAVENYLSSSKQFIEKMIKRNNSTAGRHSQESASQLKVAYKTYFFFIRAFQDECYGVLLNLHGQSSGHSPLMKTCINNKKSLLYNKVTAIAGYAEWFVDFRDKRNLIKAGVGFSLCGPESDVGVAFNKVTPGRGIEVNVGEGGHKCRLGDMVAAIDYSTALVKLIKNSIPENTSSTDKTLQSNN